MNALLTNPLPVILALVIGILIGVLAAMVFRGEPKPPQDGETLPKKFADKGYIEAMRIYFSPAAKKALPHLDGDYYEDFSSLTLEQKARSQRLIDALVEWSGRSPVQKPVAQPAVTPPPGEYSARAAQPAAPAAATPLQTIRPLEVVTPVVDKQEPLTIVEQINDIVEELSSTLSARERSVRLIDNGHQGVIVWVGMEKFSSVDEVPYPEVQGLIKTAVERWEASAVRQPKNE
jgi:hypothetical protein